MNLNHRSKYSAVAAAVAVACAVGANTTADAASAVAGATLTLSQQYIAAATATLGQNVTFGAAIGANYVVGDRMRVSVSGAEFLTSGSIASPNAITTVTIGTTSTVTQTCANVDVIGFSDVNTASFRINGGSLASGSTCYFTLPVKVSTVASTGATMSFSSQFSTGESLEAAVSRGVIATSDQFSASVVKTLAGTVDVEKARYQFASDDVSATTALAGNESQLVVSLGNATTGLAGVAKVNTATITVVGDFSWLDDTSAGFNTCAADDAASGNAQAALVQASGGSAVTSLNCGTLSYAITGGAAGEFTSGLVTIALGKTNAATAAAGTYDRTIPAPSSYTASVTFSYSQATAVSTATELASTSAGSFSLNGSTIYVPFLPYNSSTTRVVYLTNRSDQVGAVTASAVADGSGAACPSFTVTTAKANGVTLLTAGIDAGIRACYGADYDGKVALTIVSNIPGGRAEIFSGYNRNGSLTTVVNSSNGRDSTNTRN
jgi:hypothetical protein